MPSLDSLNLFREVAQCGSFSEVARKLDQPPSSVSRKIDGLERELGVRLFQRSTRKMVLTDIGQHYLGRIGNVVDELDRIHEELADFGRRPRGLLRVTAPSEFSRLQLAPRLTRFLAQNDQVQIDLIVADHYIDLARERIDVAIRFGQLRDSTMVVRRIAADPAVICASPDYLRRAGVPEFPADLALHNCLQFRPPGETARLGRPESRWQFVQNGESFEVDVRGNITSSSVAPLISAALHGAGTIIAPYWSVQNLIEDGRFVRLLGDFAVAWNTDDRAVYVAYPSARYLPIKVRAFIDFLVDDFQDMRPTDSWKGAMG